MEHRSCLLKTVTHLYTCHAHTCPYAPTKLLALPTQSYYSQSYIKSLRDQVTLVILLVLFVCCCTIQTNTHIELFSNMCGGKALHHILLYMHVNVIVRLDVPIAMLWLPKHSSWCLFSVFNYIGSLDILLDCLFGAFVHWQGFVCGSCDC